ncbi:regulatory-associated protein of mTOR-like isoform X2 [Mya arenaria]|uniref:regulatory-associated protein of mTOR-like isoform X2 n=1 Tax=Mya arenaria TaxID=6604 RepID=UPI0022DE9DCC|nr:regulatory-associated protein of mTOR-like isoform X2 [Mya arenaria]
MVTVPKDMAKALNEGGYFLDDDDEVSDAKLTIAYNEFRHREKIEGSEKVKQSWRMKERMKTVSVALVLCLNVGVDPPDVVKTSPCARLECWIDPLAQSPQKALEAIGKNLQTQYERWQPRARYKQTLDPTVEEVKKLCTSLRRNAKEERVLFHYNGHGVPKPTVNGEIWVFNKSYTQYIPLSIYDLQTWMGSPSIYVYDCSHAGIIVELFKTFSIQRDQEAAAVNGKSHTAANGPSARHCIQLAACGPSELLPMNPELPADLFTSCLTTPIKIALIWYVLQNTSRLVPGLTQDMVDKVPGLLNDRRTMLGELNWIFTAITDTIAWNTLPRDLFQKLFRQDLLVASLFRNFLLAERIMRSYNCTPISSPKLPPTYQHPMWQAWDLALDLCLRQLPRLLEDDSAVFQHSPFFTEQLTAFDVWLKYGDESRAPPEQLPIVLQVLLSQVHRLRALELLGRFLDLGPWAVSLALSVGIFPYVLKLLQSNARELRPLLVFIWAKILSVDSSCQGDLVKDNGHKYFLNVLGDPYMPSKQKTMAVFVLAMMVSGYKQGQEAALQGNVISICLEQLADSSALLRQWLALCLAKVWTNFDSARWCGVRDSAHEKMYKLLNDPEPEVRAAAVYALGMFISNVSEKSDHANSIDLAVGMRLIPVASDGCPLVRKELVVAYSGLILHFETQFVVAASQQMEEEKQRERTVAVVTGEASGHRHENVTIIVTPPGQEAHYRPSENVFPSGGSGSIKRSSSRGSLKNLLTSSSSRDILSMGMAGVVPAPPPLPHHFMASSMENLAHLELPSPASSRIPRAMSTSAISAAGHMSNNVYSNVWKVLLQLAVDPEHFVAEMAKNLVKLVRKKAQMLDITTPRGRPVSQSSGVSTSAPSSPSNKSFMTSVGTPPSGTLSGIMEESAEHRRQSPARSTPLTSNPTSPFTHSAQFPRSRKMFDRGPSLSEDKDDDNVPNNLPPRLTTETDFFGWSCKHFVQPINRLSEEEDPESDVFMERKFRFNRNNSVRLEAKEEQSRAGFNRLDNEIFVNRNVGIPSVITFHPYQSELAVADKDGISFWDWEQGPKVGYLVNGNPRHTKISTLEYLNAHDNTLLLCGSDDGCVRLWRNYVGEDVSPDLVSAFQAVSEMLPLTRGSGLVTNWEQHTGSLLASGDVRFIRVWDTHKELKVQDIPTGADSCVTCLASDMSGRSLLIAGCGDGSVRLFDRRLAPTECRVMTLREHGRWIVKVHLQKGPEGKIVTASNAGDLRFWDPRFTESVRSLSLQSSFTSVDIHPRADVLACGSLNQYIGVYNQSGDSLSTIKYHDGFIGQRIGTITSLAFHPYKVKLAAGSTDSYISIYSTAMKRS